MASDNIDADICEIVADPSRDGKHEYIGAAECNHCNTVFTYKFTYNGYIPDLPIVVDRCPNCHSSTKFYCREISLTRFKFARWWRDIKKRFRKE